MSALLNSAGALLALLSLVANAFLKRSKDRLASEVQDLKTTVDEVKKA